MDVETLGSQYLDYLTDADLQLLASVSGTARSPAELRSWPRLVPALIGAPEVFDAVFTRSSEERDWMVGVSPFCVFAVVVHRAASELESTSYLPERSGPRQRLPVFDVPQLADFLRDPARRLFLAELLASFARVGSGRYRVRTARGWRTRRWSELDPVRLAGLVEVVPEAERPGVYRRLGDVLLFLSGVFPDYTSTYALGPIDAGRLLRAAHLADRRPAELTETPPLDLFEQLGARWYRIACQLATVRSARLEVVSEVAERFRSARRVLNHVADRYLFPSGNAWFAPPGR